MSIALSRSRITHLAQVGGCALVLFTGTAGAAPSIGDKPAPGMETPSDGINKLPPPPKLLQERELTGRFGDSFPLSVENAEQMVAQGASPLALFVAEKALDQGGAPLSAVRWLGVKAASLLNLRQFAKARDLLAGLTEKQLTQNPVMQLTLARAYAALGDCSKARPLLSHFMSNNPNHPERFVAQRSNALCAIASGSLDEAAMQLFLYEQEPERPRPDPLLTIGLADLAERKGLSDEANAYLSPLEPFIPYWDNLFPVLARLATRQAEEGRPEAAMVQWQRMVEQPAASREQKQQARTALLELHLGLKQWAEAAALAEHLLQETNNPVLLEKHAQIFLNWAQETPVITAPNLPPKRVEGKGKAAHDQAPPAAAPQAEHASIAKDALHARLEQRRERLRLVLDHKEETAKRHTALAQLLEQERKERLGLLAPGGLLTPESLGLEQPLPQEARLLYAYGFGRAGMGNKALEMLEGLAGAEADAPRLLLLAQGNSVPGVTVTMLLEQNPASCQERTTPFLEAVAEALFAFSERGVRATIAPLQQRLELCRQLPAVANALRFEEAEQLRRGGANEKALWIYLELAFGVPGSSMGDNPNRLLPINPRVSAARLLASMGRSAETKGLEETP